MNGKLRHRGARGLRAAVAIGGLAALMSLPATGMGAVAAVQDDVLATVAIEQVQPRLELIEESGVRVTRVDIFWSTVAPTQPAKATDPADPAYDWRGADAIFIGLKERKIIPIVSVYSSPSWAAGGLGTPLGQAYNPNAPDAKMYGQFMNAVAKRYNGKFKNHGAGPKKLPKVSHFEVWNEPNLKNFFRSGEASSVAKYVGLVKAAYPQIKKANRKAVVIAGVGGPRGRNGNGNIGARTWLNGIVKAKGVKFDAYSQHIYPSSAPSKKVKAFPSWSSIDEILKTLDKKKKGMPLYITEAGYTTAKTTSATSWSPRASSALPAADLQPEAGQEPARAGGGLVQPPGQLELARRSAPCGRDQEAQLQVVPDDRTEAVHPGPAQAAGPLAPRARRGLAPDGAGPRPLIT